MRLDAETGDHHSISPEDPPEGEEYRFDWVTPSKVSEHDPTTFYFGGNRLFITRDRGNSWTRTPDLTKDIDRDTLTLMGVPGSELDISPNDGTSTYGEAVSLDQSPVDADVLWVGMDDGNLQVSRDFGESWTEVSGNVPGLPPGTYGFEAASQRYFGKSARVLSPAEAAALGHVTNRNGPTDLEAGTEAEALAEPLGALGRLEAHLDRPRAAGECFAPLFGRTIGAGEYGLALVEAMAHCLHLWHAGRATRALREDGAWAFRAA